MSKKLFLVKTVSKFTLEYLIKANDEKEARQVVYDGKAEDVNQTHDGEIVRSVKKVTTKQALKLIDASECNWLTLSEVVYPKDSNDE